MKTSIPPVLIAIALVCFSLLPAGQAVVPPPAGGYPNFTTAAGDHALQALTSGAGNTAVGTFSLFSVTTGSFNTAVGAGALDLNTGNSNTATGAAALLFNTDGTENTAHGTAALEFNETGVQNTATGAFALFSNTGPTGNSNQPSGISGSFNTANGYRALFSNNGTFNTALGVSALQSNTIGNANTAAGGYALSNNTEGNFNTAFGNAAMGLNSTGSDNTAIGGSALASATGSNCIAVGSQAGSLVGSSNNVIAIGSPGDDVDNSCFIGNIRDVQTQNANAVAVLVDSAGQLGTVSSSRRFKKDIKPMDKTSEAVLSLKPVTFHYKKDAKAIPQFGLVAEDVAEVNPDLVVRDKNGEIYSVRYDTVNAMLLNEFLKEHRHVREQDATIANLQKQVQALTAGLQKVSVLLETKEPAM